MILYDNGFIKLDYNPSTDILYVKCPDVQEMDLLYIYTAINIVVEAVANYDIKKCIVDASKTNMHVSSENHNIVMNHLASGLLATRLQKLARISSKDHAREERVKSYVKETEEEVKPAITFQNFTSRASATRWLLAD